MSIGDHNSMNDAMTSYFPFRRSLSVLRQSQGATGFLSAQSPTLEARASSEAKKKAEVETADSHGGATASQ